MSYDRLNGHRQCYIIFAQSYLSFSGLMLSSARDGSKTESFLTDSAALLSDLPFILSRQPISYHG